MKATSWLVVLFIVVAAFAGSGAFLILYAVSGAASPSPIDHEGIIAYKWRGDSDFHIIVQEGEELVSYEVDDIAFFSMEVGDPHVYVEKPAANLAIGVGFVGGLLAYGAAMVTYWSTGPLLRRRRKELQALEKEA